mmetsp:Transcript_82648/g.130739  ORF Transcript_82648/g.130739 Transcript_82648/m.130739 type:complete len:224 (+) Transcript_82648:1010-1681(+)
MQPLPVEQFHLDLRNVLQTSPQEVLVEAPGNPRSLPWLELPLHGASLPQPGLQPLELPLQLLRPASALPVDVSPLLCVVGALHPSDASLPSSSPLHHQRWVQEVLGVHLQRRLQLLSFSSPLLASSFQPASFFLLPFWLHPHQLPLVEEAAHLPWASSFSPWPLPPAPHSAPGPRLRPRSLRRRWWLQHGDVAARRWSFPAPVRPRFCWPRRRSTHPGRSKSH